MNNDQEQDRGEFAFAPTVFNDLTEMQRMAKRITELEAMLERQTARIDAVLAEREECAKVCEDSVEYAGDELARKIRARGTT
jgi:hypothetical protein